MEQETFTIYHIPNEILNHIYMFLSPCDYNIQKFVCKLTYNTIVQNLLEHVKDRKKTKIKNLQYTFYKYVVENGYTSLLEWYLETYPENSTKYIDNNLHNLSICAAKNGHWQTLEYLLIKFNFTQFVACTEYMCYAAKQNNLTRLNWCYENKAPFDLRVLEYAIKHKNIEMIHWFYEQNKTNMKIPQSSYDWTKNPNYYISNILKVSVTNTSEDDFNWALDYGFKIYYTRDIYQLCDFAVECDNIDVLKILMSHEFKEKHLTDYERQSHLSVFSTITEDSILKFLDVAIHTGSFNSFMWLTKEYKHLLDIPLTLIKLLLTKRTLHQNRMRILNYLWYEVGGETYFQSFDGKFTDSIKRMLQTEYRSRSSSRTHSNFFNYIIRLALSHDNIELVSWLKNHGFFMKFFNCTWCYIYYQRIRPDKIFDKKKFLYEKAQHSKVILEWLKNENFI